MFLPATLKIDCGQHRWLIDAIAEPHPFGLAHGGVFRDAENNSYLPDGNLEPWPQLAQRRDRIVIPQFICVYHLTPLTKVYNEALYSLSERESAMQKQIGFLVDETFWEEIAVVAASQDRSISSIARLAVREYLDKQKKGKSDGNDEPAT